MKQTKSKGVRYLIYCLLKKKYNSLTLKHSARHETCAGIQIKLGWTKKTWAMWWVSECWGEGLLLNFCISNHKRIRLEKKGREGWRVKEHKRQKKIKNRRLMFRKSGKKSWRLPPKPQVNVGENKIKNHTRIKRTCISSLQRHIILQHPSAGKTTKKQLWLTFPSIRRLLNRSLGNNMACRRAHVCVCLCVNARVNSGVCLFACARLLIPVKEAAGCFSCLYCTPYGADC